MRVGESSRWSGRGQTRPFSRERRETCDSARPLSNRVLAPFVFCFRHATMAISDNQSSASDDAWRHHLIEDRARIVQILRDSKRIAVLGIKTYESGQPAYYVPADAQRRGYEIIPVPVYYPEVTEILGEKVYRSLADVPAPVDMVNVFRRPRDIPAHVDDIIAAKPKVVWFQLGIRNDEAAERLARAGIDVVQDRCLSIEFGRAGNRK